MIAERVLSFPQANKLTTVKKCLNEVLKYGGAFSPRELYPVSTLAPFLMNSAADTTHRVSSTN